MRVRIESAVKERFCGVATYLAAIRNGLARLGAEVVDAGECDVVLHAGPHDYHGVPASPARSVVVVHDLIPEILLGDAKTRAERARALAAADAVIAVSESTKADVIREYGIDSGKISVVLHGAPRPDGELRAEAADLPRDFLFFVGRRAGYKRFLWMLRALAPLMWLHPRLRIVCAGAPFGRRERLWIAALGLWRRVKACRPDGHGMSAAYSRALALVYPSEYEGFGLPVVEAMSRGCPVVACRSSSIPEVAGEAAILFEHDDPRSLRRAVAGLLGEGGRALRGRMAALGKERASRFSWDRCSRETLEVLERALSAGGKGKGKAQA